MKGTAWGILTGSAIAPGSNSPESKESRSQMSGPGLEEGFGGRTSSKRTEVEGMESEGSSEKASFNTGLRDLESETLESFKGATHGGSSNSSAGKTSADFEPEKESNPEEALGSASFCVRAWEAKALEQMGL